MYDLEFYLFAQRNCIHDNLDLQAAARVSYLRSTLSLNGFKIASRSWIESRCTYRIIE